MKKDYEIGYKKPPKHSRFRPGQSANAKGRPKRKQLSFEQQIDEVRYGSVCYSEKGARKQASRARLSITRLFRSALQGNISAASEILKLRRHALSTDSGPIIIRVTGGPPCLDD